MGVFDEKRKFLEVLEELKHAIGNIEFDLERGCLKVQPSGDYTRYEEWLGDLDKALDLVIGVRENVSDEKGLHVIEVAKESN